MRSSSPRRRLRACVSCSQARARCHFPPGNIERHVCERCERLGLTCEAKATASLRRPRRIREPEHGVQREDTHEQDRDRDREVEDHGASQSQTPPDADKAPYGLTWHQADLILDIYTTSLLPLFPFVVIATTAAQHLHSAKPLLLRAVLLAAAPFSSPSALAAVKRDVLARVALALVVDDARGLDALQALLVCVAWADVRALCDERITTLTYAALGCAYSLGVTVPPPSVMRQLGRARPPADLLQRAETEKEKEKEERGRRDEHSLEEQRVFLGLYLALTVNSTQFGRTNPLDDLYTTHCCNRLRWTLEHPTDALLDTTVRLAQIGGQIHRAFGPSTGAANGNGVPVAGLGPDAHRRPLLPYLQRLLAGDDQEDGIRPALEAVMEGVDGQGAWAVLFRLNYLYLVVRLYEPATLALPASTTGEDAASRTECLNRCLDAVRGYIELLLSVPAASPLHYALSPATQSTYVVIMATRLLLLEIEPTADGPVWDREEARRTLDLPALADRMAAMLDQAEEARLLRAEAFAAQTGRAIDPPGADASDGKSRLVSWAEGVRGIRDWISAMMRGDTPPDIGAYGNIQTQNPLMGDLAGSGGTVGSGRGPVWFSGMWHNINWDLDDA